MESIDGKKVFSDLAAKKINVLRPVNKN